MDVTPGYKDADHVQAMHFLLENSGPDAQTGTHSGPDAQTGTHSGPDAQTGTHSGSDAQNGTSKEIELRADMSSKDAGQQLPDVIEPVKKESTSVRLEWRDLCVNVLLPQDGLCKRNKQRDVESNPKTLQILKGVSGVAEPGSLVAIMGVHGVGKTTLLNVLSQHNLASMEISGVVMVNNKNIKRKMKSISAYVEQKDIVIGTLTVKEHLRFQAMLRMDAECTREEKYDRVDEVLTQFNLVTCQDTMIGVPGRITGISGGELKRLLFASEVIVNPKILYVDDPTSGLDYFMAQTCVMALQRLAREGRTVIATIHQPSSGVFQLFDRLILLSEGRTAFQGLREDAAHFFNECGFPNPPHFNPADHYIQSIAIIAGEEEESKQRSNMICDSYTASRFAMGKTFTLENENEDTQANMSSTHTRYQQNFCTQLYTLLGRSTKQFKRDPVSSNKKVIQSIVASIIIGLIFFPQDNEQNGITTINGVLYFQLIILSFINAFSTVTSFPEELPVFFKENRLAIYRTDAYFIARQLGELPWYLLATSLQTTVIYWMAGLRGEFVKFMVFFGIAHMTSQSAISYAMMLSAIAPNTSVATALCVPCIVPLILVGGSFIKDKSIPAYMIWLKVFSWFKYAFELAQINQWDDFGPINCDINPTSACLRDGQDVLRTNGCDPNQFNTSLVCLLVLMFGFRTVAFVIILLKTYRKY